MDYKEKLKEALNADKTPDGVRGWIRISFPELAESEDESIRMWLIKQMEKFQTEAAKEECYFDFHQTERAIAWLEKQKEKKQIIAVDGDQLLKILPKPAEWSEEDKEMKLKILKYLSTRCSVVEFEEVENWLNNLSIRPHWKPSDEQMEMLQDAISYYGDSWVSHKQQLLESLYNDLKKL